MTTKIERESALVRTRITSCFEWLEEMKVPEHQKIGMICLTVYVRRIFSRTVVCSKCVLVLVDKWGWSSLTNDSGHLGVEWEPMGNYNALILLRQRVRPYVVPCQGHGCRAPLPRRSPCGYGMSLTALMHQAYYKNLGVLTFLLMNICLVVDSRICSHTPEFDLLRCEKRRWCSMAFNTVHNKDLMQRSTSRTLFHREASRFLDLRNKVIVFRRVRSSSPLHHCLGDSRE